MIDYPVTNDFVIFEAVNLPKAKIELDLPLGNKVDLSEWAVGIAPNGSPIVKSNIEDPMTNSNPKPVEVAPETSAKTKVDISVNAGMDLAELIELENLPFKISSGYRGKKSFRKGKTVLGRPSNHSKLDAEGRPMAYDVVPILGKTFNDIRNAIKNNPKVLGWFLKRGWGILEEMLDGRRGFYDINGKFHYTGATGPHFHFGPDKYGQEWFNHRYIVKGLQGFKIAPFVEFEPVIIEKPTLKFPLMNRGIDLPDDIIAITPEGALIAADNEPMINSNPTPVTTSTDAPLASTASKGAERLSQIIDEVAQEPGYENLKNPEIKNLLMLLAKRESNYVLDILAKTSTALGYFLFLDSTRRHYSQYSRAEFLKDPKEQVRAAYKLLYDILNMPMAKQLLGKGYNKAQVTALGWWYPASMKMVLNGKTNFSLGGYSIEKALKMYA